MLISNDQDFQNVSRQRNLPAPIGIDEPVRLGDMNAAVAGLAPKDSVRVSTQSNINLSAPGATIDGITMALNDRFVARFQTAGYENGGYVWNGAAVPAARSFDMQSAVNLEAAVLTVEEGSSAGTTWRQTAVNFTLGSGTVTWVPFGNAVGNASTTSTGIVRLATPAEAVAGVDATIAVTPAALAAYTGFAKKYYASFGDGSSLTYTITHNLNTRYVTAQVWRNVSPWDLVSCEIAATTVNTVTLVLTVAPTSNQFVAVVAG